MERGYYSSPLGMYDLRKDLWYEKGSPTYKQLLARGVRALVHYPKATVQPAAKAGAILRASIEDGKFHGAMAATTPVGSLVTRMRRSAQGDGTISP